MHLQFFSNQRGVSGLLESWIMPVRSFFYFHLGDAPHLLQFFKRTLQRCFYVKLQTKDWILIFGWIYPLKSWFIWWHLLLMVGAASVCQRGVFFWLFDTYCIQHSTAAHVEKSWKKPFVTLEGAVQNLVLCLGGWVALCWYRHQVLIKGKTIHRIWKHDISGSAGLILVLILIRTQR